MADVKIPQWLFIVVIISGILIMGSMFGFISLTGEVKLQQTDQSLTGDLEGDGSYSKLIFRAIDALDAATTPAGSIKIYDPINPGVLVESISLSSGTGTSTDPYLHNRQLFAKYVPAATNTHFEWGTTFYVPSGAGFSTIPSLPALTLDVYKMGDVTDNSTDKDLRIADDGTIVWDGYVTLGAATDAFDPQNDDGHAMTISCSNEDSNTAYADPRTWYDYSEIITDRQLKGSFLIVEFDLSGSSNVHTKASDYPLAWDDKDGAEYITFTTGTAALIKPLTNEMICGMYDLEGGSVYASRNGLDNILDATWDFTPMSGTNYADELDIEVSIVVNYALGYAKAQNSLSYETFNSGSAAHAFGELSSAWTYDCSIG